MPYLSLALAILLGVAGQLLLKRGLSARPTLHLSALPTLATDPFIIGGFASYGFSTLLYLNALGSLPLSLAYPAVSLGYVLITLLSNRLFDEVITRRHWASILIICLGVAVLGLS
jgi:multidrug transporter EmrE-like cation transporter